MHKDGLLIDKFKFFKHWTEKDVFDALSSSFEDELKTKNGDQIT